MERRFEGACMSVPFEYEIWAAQQCADYLGQSYSQFVKRTQYAEGFPKRCPIPGQPRWPALAVTQWANPSQTHSDEAERNVA